MGQNTTLCKWWETSLHPNAKKQKCPTFPSDSSSQPDPIRGVMDDPHLIGFGIADVERRFDNMACLCKLISLGE